MPAGAVGGAEIDAIGTAIGGSAEAATATSSAAG